jgi:adenine-specific DNA-methyltransferase
MTHPLDILNAMVLTGTPDEVDSLQSSPSEHTKAHGVHYTPPELAEFLARHAWSGARAQTTIRVLDPACGGGELLAAFVQTAPDGANIELVGLDIDAQAIELAEERLSPATGANVSFELRTADFLDEVSKESSALTLFETSKRNQPYRGTFDIVIANPPYVRTQVLGSNRAQEIAKAFGLSGRVDLYHAFVLGMTAALREGGRLSLLCSNRFLTTKSGKDLRRHIATSYALQHIYDLGDSRLFGAAVLPAVVVAQKDEEGSQECELTKVYEVQSESHDSFRTFNSVLEAIELGISGTVEVGDKHFEINSGHIAGIHGGDQPWVGTPRGLVLAIDRRTKMRASHLGKIRVGIKTTADSIFIKNDWSAVEDGLRPERQLLLPLITHHVARRWRGAIHQAQVLYPYDLTASRRTPLALDEWPSASRYLESHRDRLSARKYVTSGGRHWWEIWVPQRPAEWARPKIVFPDISEEPKFFIDRSGAIVNGDCYWLPIQDGQEELAYLFLAVANSSFGTYFYDSTCGNRLYAGRRRFITQYVEKYPIPDPGSADARQMIEMASNLCNTEMSVELSQELEAQLDVFVWRSFGLEDGLRERNL